jgi:hypothetical protein
MSGKRRNFSAQLRFKVALEAIREAFWQPTRLPLRDPTSGQKVRVPWIFTVLAPLGFFPAYDLPVFAPGARSIPYRF